MKKFISFFLLSIMMMLMFSGCIVSGEELLSLPKAPSRYIEVQKSMDAILSQDAQYLAPVSGFNRNSIQFVDLDGDRIDEVLSCFLVKNGEISTPRVYIHKLTDGEYKEIAHIDGYGDSIDSIWFPNLFLDENSAVAIGWRLGNSPKCGVTVISLENDTLRTLYSGEYSALSVIDLDSDGTDEIVILSYSSTTDPGTAKLLSYESNELLEISTAPLSQGIVSPGKVRNVLIGSSTPAVVSEGKLYDNGYVSDCLIFSNGVLQNVFYSEENGYSLPTFRTTPIYSSDINSDGIIEFPKVLSASENVNPEFIWRIDWCQYSADSILSNTVSALHNINDKWMYTYPDELIGKISVSPGQEISETNSIVFSAIGSAENPGGALWEIHRINGENRSEILAQNSLTELARTFDTIYACRIIDRTNEYSQTVEDIKQSFELIQNEWIYEHWAESSDEANKGE